MKDYQKGPNSGFKNRKKAVLWRDKYVCQYCGVNCITANLVAEVDHVIPRSRGGTSAWKNLVCACQPCNRAKGNRTTDEFGHSKIQGEIFTYPAWLQKGKTYIKGELSLIAPLEVQYGWQTANKRTQFGLSKSHTDDAIALALRHYNFENSVGVFEIVARRRRHAHSRKHNGYAGFRHYDLIRWEKRNGEKHLGTVGSFCPSRKTANCRFSFNSNCPVSIGRLRLVQHSGSLIYLPQDKKETAPQSADG